VQEGIMAVWRSLVADPQKRPETTVKNNHIEGRGYLTSPVRE
jgi:hypothetical protein